MPKDLLNACTAFLCRRVDGGNEAITRRRVRPWAQEYHREEKGRDESKLENVDGGEENE